MNETMSYYEVLGVDTSTPSSHMREAYVQRIREYPNETHPNEFQLIRKAYEVLSDEHKRADYDRIGQDDETYNQLYNHALETMGKENYYEAIQILEEFLVHFPGDRNGRYQKAYAHNQINEISKAKLLVNQLILEDPTNINYLDLSAQLFYKEGNVDKAISQIEKAINIAPHEAGLYFWLSNIYVEMKEYYSAARTLERKLVDGESVQDFTLLLELFYIHRLNGSNDRANNALDRITKLPQNDSEREQIIHWLIEKCQELTTDHVWFEELVRLIRNMNNNKYEDVNDWLNQFNTYEETAATTVNYDYAGANNNSSNTQVESHNSGRGSILVSIIIGIIASFIFSPIGGIIAGFIWYFNAERIKAVLGCLVLIVIVLAIIGFIFF